MPLWLAMVVAVATPVLAFVGAFSGHLLARRSAREHEVTTRRDHCLQMIRWASEQLELGGESAVRAVDVLEALGETDMVDPMSQSLIDATLARSIGGNSAYTELQGYPEQEVRDEQHGDEQRDQDEPQ